MNGSDSKIDLGGYARFADPNNGESPSLKNKYGEGPFKVLRLGANLHLQNKEGEEFIAARTLFYPSSPPG